MAKPNILMIMADQHPVFVTGCYGHSIVKTPTLDRLSEDGTVFDAAYCASPLCAPSRASMLTSQHVHRIGAWDNAAPFGSDWPTFVHSLRVGGYNTVLCGKMHFVGPDQRHGFEDRWTNDIYPTTFDWTYPCRDGVYVNPPGKGQAIHRVFESGVGWTPDMDYDEEVSFRACHGLRRLSRRKDKRPFFLCVSFTGPHYPFYAPRRYWDLYDDSDIELPVVPEDYRARDHAYGDWYRANTHLDDLVPDQVSIRARHAVLSRVTMIDDYIARIMSTLSDFGMADDTIVIYTSDHGEMMGEHGLWFKSCAYDWSSRVPLIVHVPGKTARRVGETVSLLDLGPTLCSLAGIDQLYSCHDGRDISGLLDGSCAEGDGLAIAEYYGMGTWRGWRMTRRGRYKLVYVPSRKPQLYDMENDPEEWDDLAKRPEFRRITEDLVGVTLKNWAPDLCDEQRWQSEERRAAVFKALSHGEPVDWNVMPSPVPHALSEP